MAKETKVGLLAGLAFIICFAVILANRGQQEPVSAQAAMPLPASSGTPVVEAPRGPRGAATEAPRQVVDVRRPVPREPVRNLTRPAGSGAEVELPASSPAGRPAAPQPATREPAAADATEQARVAYARPESPAERQRLLEEHLNQLAARQAVRDQSTEAASPPASQQPTNPPSHDAARTTPSRSTTAGGATPPAGGIKYTVASGDTLSRIAARHYGSSAKNVLDAILDANRGVLSDPDKLLVGMELTLPVLHGHAAASPSRAMTVAATPLAGRQPGEDAAETGSPTFRWYQVQKNDRYVSIAREQLGDESRWRELFELNKDKFPDPRRIREGVRIKIPINGSGGADR